MTFNVQNLFDNADDPGRDDATFFTLKEKQNDRHRDSCADIPVKSWRDECLELDWSDALVDQKLSAVASAILQVRDGRGPDILALQEIENLAILERLRIEHLDDAGYLPAILLEGYDFRGIDVAFLSRLPLAEPAQLHALPPEGIDPDRYGDTRGVLEATFELPNGDLLTGYAVHFPAPFHPTEMRETAYTQLNDLRNALPDDRFAFAAGDFNTTSRENGEKNMLRRLARPDWTVVHEEACTDCPGTYYYGRDETWSFLDMILWSPARTRGEKATWRLRAGSVAIANRASGQSTDQGTPARFNAPGGDGISDHWPLIFSIELK